MGRVEFYLFGTLGFMGKAKPRPNPLFLPFFLHSLLEHFRALTLRQALEEEVITCTELGQDLLRPSNPSISQRVGGGIIL